MQVHDLLINSAQKNPDAPFIREQGKWTSYSTVLDKAMRLARYLHVDLALPRGSRVALYWENSAGAISASFGIWLSGCVLVSLNTELRGADLEYQIRHSDAQALIAGAKQLRHVHAIAAQPDNVRSIVAEGILPPQNTIAIPCVSWEQITEEGLLLKSPVHSIDIDLACIVYTSGSTGEPKGVMLTHLNLVSNMHSICEYLGLTRNDRIMMILPHFYIYGLSLVLTHTLVGGGIILDNRFMYPNTVLATMQEAGATGFSGVPSTFSILLSTSAVREMDFPSLRYVTQAGGAMPQSVQKEVAAIFSPARLFIMYGATEAAPRLSYLDPDMLESKWGSIGKAVPNVDLFVADPDGNRLPSGTEGEIVARGSNITRGYWKDPEMSAQVLRNGLYFTGDLGIEDEDGFLYVTGRSKDIIKVKGFRVSPKEIEEYLSSIDDVAEACVIGVEDEILGEAPVAYIIMKNEARPDRDKISVILQSKLPAYKIPVDYIFVDSLPVGAAGKVQKKELVKEYSRYKERNKK